MDEKGMAKDDRGMTGSGGRKAFLHANISWYGFRQAVISWGADWDAGIIAVSFGFIVNG